MPPVSSVIVHGYLDRSLDASVRLFSNKWYQSHGWIGSRDVCGGSWWKHEGSMFHGRQEDSLIWCKVEHGAIDGSIGVVEHFGRVA